jgi:hypothetical protein
VEAAAPRGCLVVRAVDRGAAQRHLGGQVRRALRHVDAVRRSRLAVRARAVERAPADEVVAERERDSAGVLAAA